MLNKKLLKSEVINGVNVTLSKHWMPCNPESECCFVIRRSDEEQPGTCYMHGEAEIYFKMACDEVRGWINS